MSNYIHHRMLEIYYNGNLVIAVPATMTIEQFVNLKDPSENSIIPPGLICKIAEFDTEEPAHTLCRQDLPQPVLADGQQ